jgi:hypothetical protein
MRPDFKEVTSAIGTKDEKSMISHGSGSGISNGFTGA